MSDTHIPEAGNELPKQVLEAFRGVDLILHAGDVNSYTVLDQLEGIAPVLAALGDHDYAAPTRRWQEKHVLKLEGHLIWLFHIMPYYFGAGIGQEWKAPVKDQEEQPDIIVFGHEHRAVVEKAAGILCINPGSPTFPNRERGLGTVGLLELSPGKAEGQIMSL